MSAVGNDLRSVLVLAPMPIELAPVAKRLGLARASASEGGSADLRRGRVGGIEVIATLGGIGTAAAAAIARRMIEAHDPDLVVVCGVAGGLGPTVQIGDLVVPETVTDLDTGASYAPTALGDARPAGRLVTSGQLITDRSVLQAHADAGIAAIDMETAAVAAESQAAGKPWIAFRGISDHLRDDLIDEHTIGLMHDDGRPNVAALARYVARRPANVGRLAKMARGTKAATTVATRALQRALEAQAASTLG
ncbi:MAG: 5-methylthioadenosine nucleosidase [Acidimicrobiales bacterium]|nr:5-methylthioadenosine nucleosidase [Acidimicrobiales bacterium]